MLKPFVMRFLSLPRLGAIVVDSPLIAAPLKLSRSQIRHAHLSSSSLIRSGSRPFLIVPHASTWSTHPYVRSSSSSSLSRLTPCITSISSFPSRFNLRPSSSIVPSSHRSLTYVQGQTHEKRREYFYYIDHHGQLFLDDARIKNFTSCFKDKEFLLFFFQRLKLNDTGNYEDEFPYLSPCGRERNYVRCDDVPIVFTHFLGIDGAVEELQSMQQHQQQQQQQPQQQHLLLSWGGAGDKLTTVFEPWRICMLPSTGRVYHPTTTDPKTVSASSSSIPSTPKPSKDLPPLGLIKSSLAIELAKYFDFESGEEEPPTHFHWSGERYRLTNELVEMAEKYSTEEE